MSGATTLKLLTVLAFTASALWTVAYLTMAVSYTMLGILGLVYVCSIALGMLIVGRLKRTQAAY